MQRARTQEAKEDRRAAFAAAALEEFYEKGFTAARMEDIAHRAGFSKGALYLYFDSKEALFEAVVENFATPNIERLETVAAASESASQVIDAIVSWAPSIIRAGQIPKIAKILIGDATAFPAVTTAYRKNIIERVLAAITQVLMKAKAAGEVEIENPALTVRLIVAPMILSAIWRILFEHDPEARLDLDALFAQHAIYLKRALRMEGAS